MKTLKTQSNREWNGGYQRLEGEGKGETLIKDMITSFNNKSDSIQFRPPHSLVFSSICHIIVTQIFVEQVN